MANARGVMKSKKEKKSIRIPCCLKSDDLKKARDLFGHNMKDKLFGCLSQADRLLLLTEKGASTVVQLFMSA